MEMIRSMIGQIGVFMICAQAVLHFRPKESYGKYLRMLLGVMILVQIFSPVYGLLFGEEGTTLADNVRKFQEEMENSMGEASERSAVSDQQLESMSLKMLQEIWLQEGYEEAGEEAGNTGGTGAAVQEGMTGAESREAAMQEGMTGTESRETAVSEETDRTAVEKVEISIEPVIVTE